MDRTRAFYEKVIGVELSKLENPGLEPGMEFWAFPMKLNGFGASGALVKMPGFPSGANGWSMKYRLHRITVFQ